jgi:hypothetical protein
MKNCKVNSTNSTYLYDTKRKLEIKLIEARQDLMTVDSQYQVKKDIFVRNQAYRESLLSQHNDLSQRRVQLEKIHREAASAGNQVEYLKDQISELREERNRL